MKVPMPAISDPGVFVYDPDAPTKYTEALSHALHLILYTLSSAGAEIEDSPSFASIFQIDKDRDFDRITIASDVSSLTEIGEIL